MKCYRFLAVSALIVFFTLINIRAGDNDTVTLYDTGYRGEGMVIAILDNEFDVSHEMFVLSGDTVPKLTEDDVHNIIKEGLNCSQNVINKGLNPYVSAKIPFAFDYSAGSTDTYSNTVEVHGTHVAGIIGANNVNGLENGFDGVAPEAQLILMKISDVNGVLSDAAIYAAFEDALKLGADVINCSFGSDSGYVFGGLSYMDTIDYELTGVIYESLTDLIAAVGNASRIGTGSVYDTAYGIKNPLTISPDYGTAGVPSIYSQNIAVANAGVFRDYRMILSDGSDFVYATTYNDFYDSLKSLQFEYVLIPNIGEKADYKQLKTDLNGKIAVVERGTITFDEKIETAHKAGASAVIIYNNIPGELDFTPSISYTEIPSVVITREAGLALVNNNEEVKWVRVPESGDEEIKMNSSSSWGATGMLTLKPDIAALGTEIYSTSPDDGYRRMTGTSMSSPYISGAAALTRQFMAANGIEITGESLVRQYLMTAAEPIVNPDNGVEYSPRVQGAGLVNTDNVFALDVLLWNEKSGETKVELGEIVSDTFEIKFTARNLSDTEQSYAIDASVLTDGYFYHAESQNYFTADHSDILKYSEITSDDIITIPPFETVEITVTVTLSQLDIQKYKRAFIYGFFVEGFVYLVPVDEHGVTASIPFMGYYGDWAGIPVEIAGYYDSLPFTVTPSLGVEWNRDIEYANDIGIYLTRDVIVNKVDIVNKNGNVIENLFSNKINSAYYTKMVPSGTDYLFKNSSYWDGRDAANKKYVYPDGEYIMKVTYVIPYKPDIEKVLEIPFLIDTVAPVLKSYYVENGVLQLCIEDDNFVHAVIFNGISVYAEIAKEAEVSIDLSEAARGDYIYIYIIDVAGNIKVEKIYIPE